MTADRILDDAEAAEVNATVEGLLERLMRAYAEADVPPHARELEAVGQILSALSTLTHCLAIHAEARVEALIGAEHRRDIVLNVAAVLADRAGHTIHRFQPQARRRAVRDLAQVVADRARGALD